jgi:ribose transport system permease protein
VSTPPQSGESPRIRETEAPDGSKDTRMARQGSWGSAGASLGKRMGEGSLRYLGVGGVLLLLIAVLAITQPRFATYGNLLVILETNAVLLIVGIGLTFVLLAGGFDLSTGGVLAASGIVLAKLVVLGVPQPLAVLLVIPVGVLLGGGINGFLIARVGLNFFVVTLGTLSLFRGVALTVTDGQTQGLYEADFIRGLGGGRPAGVPSSVIIAVLLLVIAVLVTRYTGFGRMVYAVGGNPEAARLAGISVVGVRIATFAISGGLASLAGVLEAGRLAAAAPNAAPGIELAAAAAVLLGGTSFLGGVGSVFGTFLGVLFLGVLSNGLTIAGVSAFWQGIVSGSVLILAVLIDRLRGSTSV